MSGLIYRPASLDDFDTYFEINAAEIREIFGSFAMSREEVLADWCPPGFDLATATLAAFTPAGEMVGYAHVQDYQHLPVRPRLFGYVLPQYRGQGIGTHLVQWGIERGKQVIARVPEEARVVLQGYGLVPSADALLLEHGFELERQSLQMEITFAQEPPVPSFPPGFQIVTMADGITLADIVHTMRAAQRDHRGWFERPFEKDLEQWEHEIEIFRQAFEPELYMLLRDGDVPAGEIALLTQSDEDAEKGWIASLGVVPAYRRRGLARQLLYRAFGELYRRGIRRAALNVDGASLTGANRLYEQVGMHTAQRFNVYGMELRPGIEMSNQGQA